MWFSSADVRTKNGMSVNEPGFNWHLYKSFYSLSLIELIFFHQEGNNIPYQLDYDSSELELIPLIIILIKLLLESKFLLLFLLLSSFVTLTNSLVLLHSLLISLLT